MSDDEGLTPYDLTAAEAVLEEFARSMGRAADDIRAAQPAVAEAVRKAQADGVIPYDLNDLTAEPTAYVFLKPGWEERLKELAPRVPLAFEGLSGVTQAAISAELEAPARDLFGQVPGAADCTAVAADMGIDPAVPMTAEQHAEFARRMEARLSRRLRAVPPPTTRQ